MSEVERMLHECIDAEGWSDRDKLREHAKVERGFLVWDLWDYFFGYMPMPR
jgi:hypothetical protein